MFVCAASVSIADCTGTESVTEPDKNDRKEGADLVATDAASRAFIDGLIARGEAARPGPDGKLPPRATHEIVGETPDGQPVLRRRRFLSNRWLARTDG
jgi:hypothetical protein